MNAITGIRMKNPAHPGGFVKSEIVEALELSVTDAAKALGVTRPALSALLNERAALSSEMALRLTKPIRKPKATWVEPKFFADVEYRDITSEGLLRASSFKGLSRNNRS